MIAVGLLSGGLDSTLAAKMILDQGIEVHAVNFVSPFCTCTPKSAGCSAVITAVKQLGDIPLKRMSLGDEFLEIVKNPKHGHGRNLNPCIDCRIAKLRKAGEYMKEIGAAFLFTGEVLGQRPMSQHRRALEEIEKDSGLAGYILRPLSAGLLEPTIPEKEGLVDREKLLAINGRGRSKQIEMAEDYEIKDYHCAGGGCLLTDSSFSMKLKDYFDHNPVPSSSDMPLLRVGRHFRLTDGTKVVIARDAEECNSFARLLRECDTLIRPGNFNGPSAIVQGSAITDGMSILLSYIKKETLDDAYLVVKTGASESHLAKQDWPAALTASPVDDGAKNGSRRE